MPDSARPAIGPLRVDRGGWVIEFICLTDEYMAVSFYFVVGGGGLEPPTSAMSTLRSNQLS